MNDVDAAPPVDGNQIPCSVYYVIHLTKEACLLYQQALRGGLIIIAYRIPSIPTNAEDITAYVWWAFT
ncbi:Uncharacterized protein HZ326_12646 [Fusarium oxysporum f. sp. albedinis]|nr:Uncharacterized protein HZ326_12646 [Fusarium oxysporum f. sp. albedinis]